MVVADFIAPIVDYRLKVLENVPHWRPRTDLYSWALEALLTLYMQGDYGVALAEPRADRLDRILRGG